MNKIQVSVFKEFTEDKLQDAVNNYLDCLYDKGEGGCEVIDIKYSYAFAQETECAGECDVFTAMVIYKEL